MSDNELQEVREFLSRKFYNIHRDEQGIYISNYVYGEFFRPAKSFEQACEMGLGDWLAGHLGNHWQNVGWQVEALMKLLKLDKILMSEIRFAIGYWSELKREVSSKS